MDEVMQEFLIEAREMLRDYREVMDALSSEKVIPGENLERAYRAMHTIHGASGFLALASLEELSGHAECLLWHLKETAQPPSVEEKLLLQRIEHTCGKILGRLERKGAEGPPPALLSEILERTEHGSGRKHNE